MRKSIGALAVLAALSALAGGCSRPSVQVRTADGLIEAIAPGRVIELLPGEYDLSSVKQRRTEHVRWVKVHDGYGIEIHGVEDLALVGPLDQTAKLLATPRYAYVLTLRNVRNVTLANVVLGHATKGFCTGGVVAIDDARGVDLIGCDLYGCGTEGLTLRNVRDFVLRDSVLRDCTYGIMTAEGCKRLELKNSRFTKNREYHGFVLSDSRDVVIDTCGIEGNVIRGVSEGESVLFAATSCSNVEVRNCVIENNVYRRLMAPDDSVELDGNKIVANRAPPAPKEATSGKPVPSADRPGEYVVRAGDAGFWAIAEKVYGDGRYWPLIAKANPSVDANALRPGQKLIIPPPPKKAEK